MATLATLTRMPRAYVSTAGPMACVSTQERTATILSTAINGLVVAGLHQLMDHITNILTRKEKTIHCSLSYNRNLFSLQSIAIILEFEALFL